MARTRYDEITIGEATLEEPSADLRSWREVGWIFRDGEALVIERHGAETRVRQVSL